MSNRWLAVASGLVFSVAVAGCGDPPPPPPPAPPVTVAAVLEREITEWDEFTGRMEAVNAVEIRPRVSGLHPPDRLQRGQRRPEGPAPVRDRPSPLSGGAGPSRGGAGAGANHGRIGGPRGGAGPAAGGGAGHLPRGVRYPHQRARLGRRGGACRRGRRRDRPAQPGVDRGPLPDHRTGEPGRGDRRQPGPGRAARRHAAHHRGLARPDLRVLRERRADLPQVHRPRARRIETQLSRQPEPGPAGPGQRGRVSPPGLHRLRRQSAQPRGGDHPAPRRLRQQEPRVHAGPLRPDQAGGEREVSRDAGPRPRHRHRPGQEVRAGPQAGQHGGLPPGAARPAGGRASA